MSSSTPEVPDRDGADSPSVLNGTFIDSMRRQFDDDPGNVTQAWRDFFSRNGTLASCEAPRPPASADARPDERTAASLQDRVDQLVRAYRVRGHMAADLDPLGRARPDHPELDPAHYGLTKDDLLRRFSGRTVGSGESASLRDILSRLRSTYCRSIGVQFMHIDDLDTRHWLQERMESSQNRASMNTGEQVRVLTLLTQAVVFEEFVRRKYVGAKSFSLEGCESLIPLLDRAIERAGDHGIGEIVIGMAHRGRLNVLANILQKRPEEILGEFEDSDPKRHLGRGDVKYHVGYSNDWTTLSGRKVHLSLCFNPSHLEFVNPVALGRMRAKQERAGDDKHESGLAILIHGDAAFAGEGVVQETLNLSELEAYHVGGTIHIIVNNQLGFTTSPQEGRTGMYASAIAKMLQVPIFHVNGEDPEAVTQVTRLAVDFRKVFKRDVVIDMYGFRRHGHSEGDEPSFTQPKLYGLIGDRASPREGYLKRLLKLGKIDREQADRITEEAHQQLHQAWNTLRDDNYEPLAAEPKGIWRGYRGGCEENIPDVDTTVDAKRLSAMLRALTDVPEGFNRHPKLDRPMKARRAMAEGDRALDWSAAEALAFGTLATEGIPVRLTGQDSARGTFSQRHAILHDYQTGNEYAPIQNLAPGQAAVEIANSPLSEAGVLAFEYGFSLDYPDGLVLWEAQFGDFANAAQVAIDEFIVSGEDKWNRLSGLVLLLPHGYEGQGPEHSSARLERFLMLAAEQNIQIVNLTTPAQYFHCLRRQVLRSWRKPLIVLTPKSLLRHKQAVSPLEDFTSRGFARILPDDDERMQSAERVLMCSGRIYYDLLEQRQQLGRDDVAIVRVEQLYPLPDNLLEECLAPLPDGSPVVWVQEEPENMGAWRYWRWRFPTSIVGRLPFTGVYRRESASPATGSSSSHKLEQHRLLRQAFGDAGVHAK